jgi:ferredoxin-NADP reductase
MVYSTTLIDRREIARQTMAFYFARPTGFSFTAGQYIDIDAFEETRSMTLASTPCEAHLMIVTRMTGSSFKERLRSCPLGTAVTITGPLGSFGRRLQEGVPTIALAGGIGVTPFRSMALSRTFGTWSDDRLIVSVREHDDAALLDELAQYVSTTVILSGVHGRLDQERLEHHVAMPSSCQYLIAGTEGFTATMHNILSGLGVPNPQIHHDRFSGYTDA